MIFVKLQSLLQRPDFSHLGGGGDVNRPLGQFLRVGEIAGLGAGHAECVEHERLLAAGQDLGLDGEHERGFPVANLRIFIGSQHLGGVGEDLKIVRVELQRRTKFVHRLPVTALFEQRLGQFKMRPRIARAELCGVGKFVHGFVKAAEFGEDGAEGVVRG